MPRKPPMSAKLARSLTRRSRAGSGSSASSYSVPVDRRALAAGGDEDAANGLDTDTDRAVLPPHDSDDSKIEHVPGTAGHDIDFGIRERANARLLDVHTVHFMSPVLSQGGPFRLRGRLSRIPSYGDVMAITRFRIRGHFDPDDADRVRPDARRVSAASVTLPQYPVAGLDHRLGAPSGPWPPPLSAAIPAIR
jgi:hypothetical protein